jgi:hypothetical protein
MSLPCAPVLPAPLHMARSAWYEIYPYTPLLPKPSAIELSAEYRTLNV